MAELISPELERKLRTCRGLPSPPTYALKVIELVNDPELDIDQAVKVFFLDPVIVSKILRIANSPLYANQLTVTTLQMAILVLGLNATISLALSFSLVTVLRQGKHDASLNHPLYWKRAGLAAAASRVLGIYSAWPCLEELFIAALLQDIGMLALERLCPDLYAESTLNQNCHTKVVDHERQQLGCSHATVGGWLLAQWRFPDRLHMAVTYSDDPLQVSLDDEQTTFVRCVAGAGALANLLLNEGQDQSLQETKEKLERWLGIPGEHLPRLLEELQPVLSEVDNLFDMNMSQEVHPEDLIEMARESQLLTNLNICHEVEKLKEGTISLETQYEQLKNSAQRDELTKLYNRSFLDEYLNKMFKQSLRDKSTFTLGFLDLDHFKQVNDTHGHSVGDQILKATADILQAQVRGSDVVGRYGGEEFLIVLPETPPCGAEEVFHRILEAFRQTRHPITTGQQIGVTASIGIATHSPEHPYSTIGHLIDAADQALYQVKQHGRNSIRMSEEIPKAVMSHASPAKG
ncbi:MAG: GGDEF domain-containing protein [Nitrospirota bacterium]|nr:GGDEF domain-containing protein [Nitrospirota bacterium]